MRKLSVLFVTIALVIVVSLISIAPSVLAVGPTPPARPTPQGCGWFCWTLIPAATLRVNTCDGSWSITGTPGASGVGSVRQYGAGTGSIIVVRNYNTSTSLRLYSIGVRNGSAAVYIVNTSSGDKYTFNGTPNSTPCP